MLQTDSQYVRQGITEWMPNWVRLNWRTAAGQRRSFRALIGHGIVDAGHFDPAVTG